MQLLHNIYLGQLETKDMTLKAILAQLDYRHQIMFWNQKGILFQAHMYFPEIHPITRCDFHEREDEAHVLKVKG